MTYKGYKDKERRKEYMRAYRVRNKTKLDSYMSSYYDSHREKWAYNSERDAQKSRDNSRKRRQLFPQEVIEYRTAYYYDHKEEINARTKLYHLTHRDSIAVAKRVWNVTNRDKVNAASKRWVLLNPDKKRRVAIEAQNRRRAIKLKTRHQPVDYHAIKSRDGMICGICRLPITGKFHYDHIIPLSKGGSHLTENLQLTHPRCNQMKSNKLNYVPPLLDAFSIMC